MTTAGQAAPGGHELQVSPHAFPSHGLLSGQTSMPLTHEPFSQRLKGHAAEPSAHSWHGAAICGQSWSALHWLPLQLGNEPTHWPAKHSTVGQAKLPSLHCWQAAPG
jgi:hypothetical protein